VPARGIGGGATPAVAVEEDGKGGGKVPIAICAVRGSESRPAAAVSSKSSDEEVEVAAKRAFRLGGRGPPSVPVAAKTESLSSEIFLS